MFARIEVSNKN